MPEVRPIDGNALLEELQEELDFDYLHLTDVVNSAMKSAYRIAMERVRKAPTLDAVSVVRCRECRHHDPAPAAEGTVYCTHWDICVSEDGYCHCGEMDGGTEDGLNA